MIPLFADLSGRRVVIFGGGRVAARKAAFFAKEADVLTVSRSHSKAIAALPVERMVLDVTGKTDAELERIVSGAFIVIAALPDREENNRIGKICRKMGVLFNNADGDSGDLIIPSVSGGKHYSIAITTHGKSPAVSRFVREDIDARFSMLDGMIKLQEMLRRELKRAQPSQERRSAILRDAINDPEIWETLARSQHDAEMIAKRKYLHA